MCDAILLHAAYRAMHGGDTASSSLTHRLRGDFGRCTLRRAQRQALTQPRQGRLRTIAYEGEHLYHCPATAFPWQATFAVIVSGARWNPCGHSLLNIGGMTGIYFHIAGDGNDRPFMMRGASAFQRYLRENGKRELRRQHVPIPEPQGAQAKLEALTSKSWLWGVLPNNCASFVEEVIQAGGSKMGLYSNCPSRERF